MSVRDPVTRHLLQELLVAIPPFTTLEPYRDLNLNIWRESGAFQPITCTTQKIHLAINNQREYAAALFSDAQHLINQVSEHRAHLVNSLGTNREPSPTWIFVTVYYMALYAAMAFTRSANSAVVYLDSDAIAKFCGNLTGKRPGGGAFIASSSSSPSTGLAGIQISKYKSHFHEAVWAKTSAIADTAYRWIESQTAARTTTADELLHLRALNLFRKVKFESGSLWPSRLRNALNYRPGFSYRSIPKNNILRINSKLAKAPFAGFEELVIFGERALLNIGTAKHPVDVANESVNLLVAYGLILENYANNSFDAVCKMHDLSCSASVQRIRFNQQHSRQPANILTILQS